MKWFGFGKSSWPAACLAAYIPNNGVWRVSVSDGERFDSSRWETWNPTVDWADVLVGDFNGDGKDDLVARVDHNRAVRVSVSLGNRFTSSRWDGPIRPSADYVQPEPPTLESRNRPR